MHKRGTNLLGPVTSVLQHFTGVDACVKPLPQANVLHNALLFLCERDAEEAVHHLGDQDRGSRQVFEPQEQDLFFVHFRHRFDPSRHPLAHVNDLLVVVVHLRARTRTQQGRFHDCQDGRRVSIAIMHVDTCVMHPDARARVFITMHEHEHEHEHV